MARYTFAPELITAIAKMVEFAPGGTQLSVRLANGEVVNDLCVSNCKVVIGSRNHDDMPFRMEDVVEVFQSDDDRAATRRGGWILWKDALIEAGMKGACASLTGSANQPNKPQ